MIAELRRPSGMLLWAVYFQATRAGAELEYPLPAIEPVQVLCSRCEASWDCQLATSAVSANSLAGSGDCPKCSRSWSLDFRPVLAHAYNSIVAHLRPENCRPVDLTPSLFACQCGSCSSVATFKYGPNRPGPPQPAFDDL